MKQKSCLNCTGRSPGCHSKCDDYIDWCALNKATKESVRLDKLMSNGYQPGRSRVAKGHHATNTNRNVSYKYGGRSK